MMDALPRPNPRRAMNMAIARVAALAALSMAGASSQAQWHGRARPGAAPPVVCPAGSTACSGPFGQTCYAPSRGERCTQGLVCGFGQQPCVGPYGGTCFSPSQGQRCAQGLVCAFGQQVCMRNGYATCFSPAQGETCR